MCYRGEPWVQEVERAYDRNRLEGVAELDKTGNDDESCGEASKGHSLKLNDTLRQKPKGKTPGRYATPEPIVQ